MSVKPKKSLTKQTVKEQIDISKEASDLPVHSEGSLELLDRKTRIQMHLLKERAVVWLSIFVICCLLFVSVGIFVWSEDESTRDWARQTLSALLGFAAGAIWNSTSTK